MADQTAVNIEKASAEVGDAERRLRLLQRELLEANGRARIEYDKLVLARSRLEGYSTLAARGLISRAALVQHHTNVLEAEAAVSQARSSVLGIEREIANAEAEARASRLNGRLAASEGQAGRAALVERLTTASRQQGSRIYASSDGTVGAVPVSLGQTVAGGETIAWLMPNQGRLEVEIYVAAANAAQVRVGQEVRVHFQDERNSSLSLTGRVRAVTMNALPPNEIALPSANLEEPVFVTRVALPTDFGGHNLRAGTPVRATILVRRQTLLARILQPPSAAGRQ
ncbi:MAG TPA: HlyD family efflux transporter periplasmic adaptor subunit [Allosphingosinicella sp.]|nr:HlyD family efflux transporter periplasmic adaptor subunit [Allosphingosinicella sp.]